MNRYEAVFGFNSKQWWAYDSETDEYCDPPIMVLREIEEYSNDIDEQQYYFEQKILVSEPDWLNDQDYRYSDIDI